MRNRYTLFRRHGVFYSQDSETKKQISLKTADRAEAVTILNAKNEALRQPMLNLELAKAYLSASDARFAQRTWGEVMKEYGMHGRDSTQERAARMAKSPQLDALRDRKLCETSAEEFLKVLRSGGAALNNYLRRYHNLALKMGWLPRPVLFPGLWPKVKAKRRRAINREEFDQIIAAEHNRERRAYYQLLWETGAAQADGAQIKGEDVDWNRNVLFYQRMKLVPESAPCALELSVTLADLLKDLPAEGFLFPRIARETSPMRASEFRRRCMLVGIEGVSLHSFRYSWAERACSAGIAERFAQAALGHGSKAVHRAYARGANVICPAPVLPPSAGSHASHLAFSRKVSAVRSSVARQSLTREEAQDLAAPMSTLVHEEDSKQRGSGRPRTTSK